MVLSSTDTRTKYIVGATAGATVGAAGSAATGLAITRALSAIGSTSVVQGATARIAAVTPAAVMRLAPKAGMAGLLALSGLALYQAVAPVAAQAQAARKKNSPTPAPSWDNEEAFLKERQKRAAEMVRRADARGDTVSAAQWRSWGADVESMRAQFKARRLGVEPSAPGDAAATPAATPAPPVEAPRTTLWQDVKGMFASKPDPAFEQRRKALLDSRAIIDRQMAKGSVILPATQAALDKNNKDMEALAKEQRDSNPLRQGVQVALPVGAAIGGFLTGGMFSGVKNIKAHAEAVTKSIDRAARQADRLIRARPNGLIAGTPTGDKAKGLVNEVYAIGGAKPAFASPGYPAAATPAQKVFSNYGKPTTADFALPALNFSVGAAGITASLFDPNENMRQAERVIGGFEVGMGLGQWKKLMAYKAMRPAASAVASIEGLRNRLTREMATGAPAGVAASRAATKLQLTRTAGARTTGTAATRAEFAGKREVIRGKGGVEAARRSAQMPAIEAGTRAGVAKAEGAGKVARAVDRNKLGPPKYKDTWQDSRGVTYRRRDMSVRNAERRKGTPPRTRAAKAG